MLRKACSITINFKHFIHMVNMFQTGMMVTGVSFTKFIWLEPSDSKLSLSLKSLIKHWFRMLVTDHAGKPPMHSGYIMLLLRRKTSNLQPKRHTFISVNQIKRNNACQSWISVNTSDNIYQIMSISSENGQCFCWK